MLESEDIETKTYDIQALTYVVESSGSLISLCTPENEDGADGRIGLKILVTGIEIRGSIYATWAAQRFGAGSAAAQVVRMVIFADNQSNTSVPTLSDVFIQSPFVYSPYNMNNRSRFSILYDKSLALDPYYRNTTTNLASACHVNVKKLINIHLPLERVISFIGPNGNYGEIASGGLWCFLIGEIGAPDTGALATMTIRTYYIE